MARSADLPPTSAADAASLFRPMPPRTSPAALRDVGDADRARQCAGRPIRVGLIVGTFTFGGSETETIELVYGANPNRLVFSGIAVKLPRPLPDGEPPKDGSFPLIYTVASDKIDASEPRVRLVATFEDAVQAVIGKSDIILTWGIPSLQEHLPEGALPPIVVVSKDSGDWAKRFLHSNSLLTRYCVANSTVAASAFPTRVQGRVRIIHDGINLNRVVPRISREAQRRLWDLEVGDKVAGYLGRIEADKGAAKTVDGVALLGSEWKVVFIGANPNCRFVRELERQCKAKIPGRYRLLDWCHDVGSALAAFDVFCHPSDHEGFSNSLAEAWLAGVPTIYTAGTGAIPDLGEMGVPVSARANGTEIANALRGAYRNELLAARARAVIENNYLVTHYVRRWTDYLAWVLRQPRTLRILVLCPDAFIDRAYSWILSMCHSCHGAHLCGVLVVAEGPATVDPRLMSIERAYACPIWPINYQEEVDFAVKYARPDVIVAWGIATLTHVLTNVARVPVVGAFDLSRFDPISSGAVSSAWMRSLKSVVGDVY